MNQSNNKIYFCNREKAKKLINCLKLNDIAEKSKVFTVNFLDITVIIYDGKHKDI